MTYQPRDIHGTPIYVGDRVAIATEKFVETPVLIVRLVTRIEGGLVWVPDIDGFDGLYGFQEVSNQFLRLP